MTIAYKTLNCCHENRQGPPLSHFCNNPIIIRFDLSSLTSYPLMQCEQRANHTLEFHLRIGEATFRAQRTVAERRAKPRSSDSLPARVWGVDRDDHPFSLDCLLENMSASGLYLRLPRRMKFSAAISLVVRLPNGPVDGRLAAINGTVIRDQIERDGNTGVGVKIVEHSFI